MTNKNKAIFDIVAKKLIDAGVISEDECMLIARTESRKGRYWKRHILDLCNYSLNKMDRQHIDNPQMRRVCETGIRIARDETTTHAS